MITEDYISFELAKLLKEKGFDENTHCQYLVSGAHYGEIGEYNITDRSRNPEWFIQAPTLQMVMKWLRERHQIFIHIQRCKKIKFFFTIENMNISGENYEYSLGHFKEFERNTYEEVCEAAIKYCLENLI